jgi:hypothetical protein
VGVQDAGYDVWSSIFANDESTSNEMDVAGWKQWFVTIQQEFESAMEKLQCTTIMDPRHASEGFMEALAAAKWQHSRFCAALQAYNSFCEAVILRMQLSDPQSTQPPRADDLRH